MKLCVKKGENISQRIGDLVEGKVECANVSMDQMRRLLESPVELVAFFVTRSSETTPSSSHAYHTVPYHTV